MLQLPILANRKLATVLATVIVMLALGHAVARAEQLSAVVI